MSANKFVSLEVPTSQGVGAEADISDLAFGVSLVVNGPPNSVGEILIEISGDGVNFVPITAIFPIHNPPVLILPFVAQFVRVVRFSGIGTAFVALGSSKTLNNLFGPLGLAPLDTSGMGPKKTIYVVGQYDRSIVIEGSIDGVNYGSVAVFDTLDSNTISLDGTWARMRVRPGTFVDNVAISIAGGFSGSPAANSGGQHVDEFAVSAGQTLFPVSQEPLGDLLVAVNGQLQRHVHDFDVVPIVAPPPAIAVKWQSPDFSLATTDTIQIAYTQAQ